MKKKWLWLGLLLPIFGIIIGVMSEKVGDKESKAKTPSVNTYIKSVTLKDFSIEVKSENKEQQILVNYPKTKSKKINQKLESFLSSELSAFKRATLENNPKEKGSFFQSFETYELSPDIVSFKFNVMRKNSPLLQTESQVITKTYDLKEEKELQISDLLKEKEDLQSISKYIYDKFSKEQRYSTQKAKAVLQSGLKAVEQNFNTFVLNNNSLVFYFAPHQINRDTKNYVQVSLPLRELGEVVTPRILVEHLKEEAEKSKVKIPSARQVRNKQLASKKLVALTFDDGPDPQTTPRLLSILKKENVPATFFILGNRLALYPEIVKQEYKLGHQVGSHTFNHLNLPQLPMKEVQEEIKNTADLVQKTLGIAPQGLRPPYGATTPEINAQAQTPIIQWSVDSLDWKSKNADQIEQVVMNEVYDGSIILMHDIYDSSVDGAEKVIKKLKRQGYTFVTVNQLIEARGKLENSQVYFNATR
ncbi:MULTISPECIES: polysaccharide deacetylase family protein [Lactococcus]|nr:MULTISPECIES: polysaccharide deacetylase family protein [Lactococcus]